MNIKRLINKAIKQDPPASLIWLYGNYYAPYYNLLYLLAGTMIESGLLVELGVHVGRGLASLAAASPGNLVIGLDTDYSPELDTVLDKFPNAGFLHKPSLPVPSYFAGKTINLLHIDTEHSHSMAKAEFESYRPFLANGAFVLFDDLHAMNDGVLAYFETLPYEKYQDDRLHPSCGYGVMIYSNEC